MRHGYECRFWRTTVMTALKRIALPEEYLTARPKQLRFLILNTAVGSSIMRAGSCAASPAKAGGGGWS
jgi:hypothetical protein